MQGKEIPSRRFCVPERCRPGSILTFLLVNVDIEEENGGEGASKGQYGIYQALGIQVFREELLESQCSR